MAYDQLIGQMKTYCENVIILFIIGLKDGISVNLTLKYTIFSKNKIFGSVSTLA
jgi:hypothetical protein